MGEIHSHNATCVSPLHLIITPLLAITHQPGLTLAPSRRTAIHALRRITAHKHSGSRNTAGNHPPLPAGNWRAVHTGVRDEEHESPHSTAGKSKSVTVILQWARHEIFGLTRALINNPSRAVTSGLADSTRFCELMRILPNIVQH